MRGEGPFELATEVEAARGARERERLVGLLRRVQGTCDDVADALEGPEVSHLARWLRGASQAVDEALGKEGG